MRNFLERGEKWLEGTLRKHASVWCSYRRGSSSVTLRAVPAATAFKIADESGNQTPYRQNDWLVAIAELVVDGVATEPAPGDQIIEGHGRSGDRIFEVMGIGGQDMFVEEGDYHQSYRVHTKFVGTL